MSASHEQSNSPQLPLFDVSRSVSFSTTDPSTEPQFNVEITPTDFDAAEAEAARLADASAVAPTSVVYAEAGVSVDIKERAKILDEFILPILGGVAMRDGLQDAMFTGRAEEISVRYGADTTSRVNQANENAKDMERTALNLLYHNLGYKAAAAAGVGDPNGGKREASKDLRLLKEQYGRGKTPARKAFHRVLKRQRS